MVLESWRSRSHLSLQVWSLQAMRQVSKWLKKWRWGELQQVSAVSTQLRGVPLQYPLIDEYVLRLVHGRAEAVGSLGFGNNSLTLRAKAEEYAKKLTRVGPKSMTFKRSRHNLKMRFQRQGRQKSSCLVFRKSYGRDVRVSHAVDLLRREHNMERSQIYNRTSSLFFMPLKSKHDL